MESVPWSHRFDIFHSSLEFYATFYLRWQMVGVNPIPIQSWAMILQDPSLKFSAPCGVALWLMTSWGRAQLSAIYQCFIAVSLDSGWCRPRGRKPPRPSIFERGSNVPFIFQWEAAITHISSTLRQYRALSRIYSSPTHERTSIVKFWVECVSSNLILGAAGPNQVSG